MLLKVFNSYLFCATRIGYRFVMFLLYVFFFDIFYIFDAKLLCNQILVNIIM